MIEEYGNTYVSASGYVHTLHNPEEAERAKQLAQKGGSNGRYFFTSGSTFRRPRFCYHSESSQEGLTIVAWVMTGEGEEPI